MAPTLARETGNLSRKNGKDASGTEREAGSNSHPGNGETDQRVAAGSCKMRLGPGILLGERPEVSEPRGNKDGCDRQLRSLRTARRHRLHHAMELSAMAMHPVRSTRFDGRQHNRLQTLQHNTPVRTGPPKRLRINWDHPRMLQHHSR